MMHQALSLGSIILIIIIHTHNYHTTWFHLAGGSSATPFTEDGSGSGGGPITPDPECYSEGRVNLGPLDYDFSGLLSSVVGPIEICVDGQYLSLCDIGWDEANAQALCRQRLGYNVGKQPNQWTPFVTNYPLIAHIYSG